MRIAIIGAGNIGATLGKLWTKAGHEVMLSSRHPDGLLPLVRQLGGSARVGSVGEAARFGEVALLAVPVHTYPALSAAISQDLLGKVLLDAGNPVERRDGPLAREAKGSQGSGLFTAKQFPGVRVVKAYNTIYFVTLERASGRPPPRIAVPLASDDPAALEIASKLVEDSGFEPLIVGPLLRARDFDAGTAAWNSGKTAAELRVVLGLAESA
ncbi:MAG: NAD(P)-binding domain-containing protein [Deltaproteobacteria bacterium]|nr:NAD(P)-binding domain-containing protein [Deltaproteobacteria bacterium]